MFKLILLFGLLIVITAIIKKFEEKSYQKKQNNGSSISEYEFFKLKEEVELLKEKIFKIENSK